MLRNISVAWQKIQGDVRVIKVTGAPRVSYWELKTLSGNSLGFSPANALGILTFETSFANQATLFPVNLGGSGYREGISIDSAPLGTIPSYAVTPPSTLSGPINTASGSFAITSNGITTPTTITLSSNLAGIFSQSAINLPIGSATQSFTYTPTVVGNHIISFSSSLANPSPINYTSIALPTPTYSVTPPAMLSGSTNVASGSFTIASNGITTPTTVTLSSNLAGTFSQSVINLPIGSSTQSFTYTPTIVGNHVISFSSPLTNPSPINYTVTSPPSGNYSVTPPATLSGSINTASGSFTINSSGITTPTTITLFSNLGGAFSPTVISLPIGSATRTFTYTPTVVGNHVISFSSPLANPSPINYNASPSPPGSYSVTTSATLFGEVDVTSEPFTITSSGITAPTAVTLSSSLTGTFSQPVINLPVGSATRTFTYTPAEGGDHVISFNSPLTDPSPITYVVVVI